MFRLTTLLAATVWLLGVGRSTAGTVTVGETTITTVDLKTSDIVYDPVGDMLYGAVPSSAGGTRTNSITPIDPHSGAVGASVSLGSEPGRLAIGDDGRYLYAVVGGGRSVRQFHIPTQTPAVEWSMPGGLTRVVVDIEVLPGNSESVVLSRRYVGYSPDHAGVVVYDNGVSRPVEMPGFLGAGGPNRITVNHDGTVVYGYDTRLSDHIFRRMAVDANGISQTGYYYGVVRSNQANIVYGGGRLYTNYGQVIDAESRVTLGNFAATGSVVPDAELGRTFFLSGDTIRVFDDATFLPLGEIDVPGVSGSSGSLVRVGGDGLAFRTTADQVFVVRSQLIPEPSTLILLAVGAFGLIWWRRRR